VKRRPRNSYDVARAGSIYGAEYHPNAPDAAPQCHAEPFDGVNPERVEGLRINSPRNPREYSGWGFKRTSYTPLYNPIRN